MWRSNTAFIISLIIHVLAALIFAQFHRAAATRRGDRSIAVDLNVKAPEPKLKREKVKFDQEEINPERRSVDRKVNRLVKINKNMDKTTAYRDVIIVDESTELVDIETAAAGLKTGGSFRLRSGARGAGRGMKDGGNQLVEFVDKSRGRRRIIYCMDVSASMGASNRLNLARNYLKDSLFALDSEKDSFNVIVFSESTRTFHPTDLLPATHENLSGAMDFLDEYTPQNIRANRKTNLLAVLIRALEMKPGIIALVTDGLPTAGVTNPEKIIQTVSEKNVENSVRIFAIGMEMDIEQPEAWLLKAIAEQNRGEYQLL
jgi:Mg-chelatase subunit ChlD